MRFATPRGLGVFGVGGDLATIERGYLEPRSMQSARERTWLLSPGGWEFVEVCMWACSWRKGIVWALCAVGWGRVSMLSWIRFEGCAAGTITDGNDDESL